MSTMTLKLPMNYVDVDREEMEYIDGGGYSVHWWGYAVDLNVSQCRTLKYYFQTGRNVAGITALISAGLLPPLALAAGISAAIFAQDVDTLDYAIGMGTGATLSMVRYGSGYIPYVNAW